jgi:hypothetical protein
MWNSIDVNPFVKGGAYAVATSYKFGDNTPYVYKTSDYGKTWTMITKGIPNEEFVRVVRADPKRQGLLYAGTEKGMWISFDDGASWTKMQLNLPPVPIADLAVKNDNLIAATHGRSFWMIDDLSPFHQLNTEMTTREIVLFKPMPSYRMPGGGGWRSGNRKLEGENHPGGVMIHYYVKSIDDKSDVKMEILQADGVVIKSYSNKASGQSLLTVKTGGNRFVWDMRYPGYKTFPGMVYYGSPNNGPKAVPGKYKVRLTINGNATEQEFEILKDPRIKTTQEELQSQFEFLAKVRDKVSDANQGVIDIRKIKEDLAFLKTKIGSDAQYKELSDAVKKFEEELTVHENNIHQTKNRSFQDPLNYGIKMNNRLAHLMVEEAQGDFAPTKQGEEVRQMLTKMVDEELSKLQNTIDKNADRINNMAKEKGIEVVMVKKQPIVN